MAMHRQEQGAKPPVRIVVEVTHESALQRVWVLVPSNLKRVEDLAFLLSEKFLQQQAEVVLEIDGIPVARDQDIAIIRDSDVVRISVPTAPLTLSAPGQKLFIEGPTDSVGRVEGADEAKITLPWNGTHTKEADRAASDVWRRGKPALTEEVDKQSNEFKGGRQEMKGRQKKRKKMDEAMRKETATADEQGQVRAKKGRKQTAEAGGKHELGGEKTEIEKVAKKKKKKRKLEEESGCQGEGLLQLEWIQQTGRHSAEGSQEEQIENDGTLKGSGKRPKRKEGASPKEDEPMVQTDEVGALQKAPELMDQEAMQEDSSSEEVESEDEAPKREKKTPSRSARRKSAKRRYARLAKEAAARGEAEVTRADWPPEQHQSMEGVEAFPQNERNANAVGASSVAPAQMQHMRFDESDNEGSFQKVEIARQPQITLNVGFGASGQPLSKERGKEWGKHTNRKKERHRNQNGRAEMPPPQQNGSGADQNGTYQDETVKSAEFRLLERKGEADGTTERDGREAAHTVGEKRSEAEYERLPELDRLPQVADILAYRLVELTSSWTPQMSEYREGRVTAYDAASGIISLAWWPPEDASAKTEASTRSSQDEEQEGETVEAFPPPYDEDGNLQVEYSALMGVRLVQSSERTLAQLPEAPPLAATKTASFACEGSPSTAEAANHLVPGASPIIPALEPSAEYSLATKPTPFFIEGSPSSVLEGREWYLKQMKKEMDGKPETVEDVKEADSRKGQGRQKGDVETSTMALQTDEVPEPNALNSAQTLGRHAVEKPQESKPPRLEKNGRGSRLGHSGLSDQGPQEKPQGLVEKVAAKRVCADVTEGLPDITRGSGQTPQAWRQWESVAHLLANRRAEIARQAALQKLEELKRLKENVQEAETNGNGLLQGQTEIYGPEREERVVAGTDAVASQKPETEEAAAMILERKASLTEVEAVVVNEGISKRSENKHAETSNTEELPTSAAPESHRSEPLSSQAVPLGAQQASDLPLTSPKTDLQTGVPNGGDLEEARDLLGSSGRKDDIHITRPGSVGKKDETQKNALKASAVSVRGAMKPRGPRLGALGPTLAYLRAQQNQLG